MSAGKRPPILTSRELVRVGKAYALRYGPTPTLARAEYNARMRAIAAELYPTKRYPGAILPTTDNTK